MSGSVKRGLPPTYGGSSDGRDGGSEVETLRSERYIAQFEAK